MRKQPIIWGIILIFFFSNIFPTISSGNISSNNIIYVADYGDTDYTRVQNAIDNSTNGDSIYL